MKKLKGVRKYLGVCILLLYMTAFLGGCGNTDTEAMDKDPAADRSFLNRTAAQESKEHEQAQNVYQVNYIDAFWNKGENSECLSPQMTKEAFYYQNTEDEIYEVIFLGQEQGVFAERLPIELAEDESLRCFATKDGLDFYCFLEDASGRLQLKQYDFEGNVTAAGELDMAPEAADKAVITEDVIYLKTGDNKVCVLDTLGHSLGEIAVPMLRDLGVTWENQVVVTYSAGQTDMALARITVADGNYMLEQIGRAPGDGILYTGQRNEVFLNDAGYLYKWDLDTGECVKYLEWLENDILPARVWAVAETEEENLWVLPGLSDEAWYLKKLSRQEKASGEGEKEELTLFTMSVGDSQLRGLIVDYNKQSAQYHVTLEELDYSDAGDAETFANTRLSGKDSPDLIMMDYYHFPIYRRAGVLENLTPYMERSGSIREEDYISSALDCFCEDNGVYAFPKTFMIQTMGGRKSQLQDILSKQEVSDGDTIPGWSVDTFLGYLEENPDVKFEWDGDSMGLLQYCLWLDMERFADFEAGSSSFGSTDFSELVSRVSKLHCQSNFYTEEWEEIVAQGDKIITELRLSDFYSLPKLEMQYKDEMLLLGYPNAAGCMKTKMVPSHIIGMLSRSRHKDGAWDFINYYLLNYQAMDGFLADKESFLEQLELARTKQYAQGDTEEELPQSYYYDPVTRSVQPVYALEDSQLQKILDAIESAEPTPPETDYILNHILWEELNPYFIGDKSLEQVLHIVSSRVELYLKE
ncbi:MAG: extracellular solute-binding protein [Roseburia sp.]|nr:extracellular solute-binding protein [Roseburia sp.]